MFSIGGARVSVVMALGLALSGAAAASTTCFPTCAPDDGRFLSLSAGSVLSTLAGLPLQVRIVPPEGATSFEVAIFDGDSGGLDDQGRSHWDIGWTPAVYTLSACPDAECRTVGPVVTVLHSPELPDNQWFGLQVTRSPSAAAYRLRMEIPPDQLSRSAMNQLKLRSDGRIVLGENEQPFSFVAEWTNIEDIVIVYPHFDRDDWFDFDRSLVDARYDGSFTFLQRVTAPASRPYPLALEIWNGDLDRGSYDGTSQDSDDPDTPSGPAVSSPCPWSLLPPFYRRADIPDYARQALCSEGVAVGQGGLTGAPADDVDTGVDFGFNRYICRPPSVYYRLEAPDGTVYVDDQPSGNREWERYCLVERDPAAPAPAAEPDVWVDSVQDGLYRVELVGMDHNNLSGWACRCVERGAVPPLEAKPGVQTDACSCTVEGTGPGGCTPGYWKQRQHFGSWSIYQPEDRFEEVFGVSVGGDPSLLDALATGGGGAAALNRHAVAALLNAASLEVDAFFGMAEIIGLVQEAYASGEFEPLKDRLAEQNEIGCPLARSELEPSDR